MRDVQHELVFAVGLVVLVTFLFLRNIPATIIPSVVVPLSLIGTFGVMYLAGFSVNNLTLMALTIATGFVVDDAIVMVENIERHIEAGETPLHAALIGAKEIGFTLISLTISLVAVLIPLLFMADVVGRLFREFAITLAVSILISLVVSLTLTPMMCARLLKQMHHADAGLVLPAERCGARRHDRGLRPHAPSGCSRHQPLTLLVALATLVLTVVLYMAVPKGFFPVQDTGAIQVITEAPQSVSFSRDGRAAAGGGAGDPAGAGRHGPVVVHRRGRQQRDAQQRAHDRHARAARAADADGHRGHREPARRACRRCRASRSTCSPCRT